jgi:nicotinate-nucleotide pyrophosphorylase (carboxylating)
MTFQAFDRDAAVEWKARDGDRIAPDQVLCTVSGTARALLSGERMALNFLQTLSGTATLARRYREQVADLPVALLDTRKTLPGLRAAQKYAVCCGGCSNHRMGLHDAILIKENHIAACGSIKKAVEKSQQLFPELQVEVEVEDLDQLAQAVAAGAHLALLDNFTVQDLRRAVALNQGRAVLEASGGITLGNVREIAETGVERISIGALTKDVQAIDLSMRLRIDR